MAQEIERKFLVADESWCALASGALRLRQAYLAATAAASVRVRIVDGKRALLTVKSARPGLVRDEFEYPVPVADAEAMLALRAGEIIDKVRHALPCADGVLTVDEFQGANAGLVIAEIELAGEAVQPALPGWIGREVTDDPRFYNASLAARPFRSWPEAERASSSA